MKGNHTEIYQTFIDRMKPYEFRESDYRLPVHFVRELAMMMLWNGMNNENQAAIDAAKWLFNYLATNHPEIREIIEGYFEAINTLEE
jgi:hypothetical protein